MLRQVCLFILFLHLPALCIRLTPNDTVSIVGSSGAMIRLNTPSCIKAWQSGLLKGGLVHTVNSRLYLTGAVECSITPSLAYLKEGMINWFPADVFKGSVGYTTLKYGVPWLFNGQEDVFGKGILWDCEGLGYSLTVSNKMFFLTHATLLNLRESCVSMCNLAYRGANMRGLIMMGVQRYDVVHQDNVVVAGTEWQWQYWIFAVRCLLNYEKYLGYGNPTGVTGYSTTDRLELKCMFPWINICTFVHYELFVKACTHSTVEWNIFPALRPVRCTEAGSGNSGIRNDKIPACIPYVAIEIMPKNQARVVFRSLFQKTASTRRVVEFEGSVWFAL